ncbi:MAG: SCO family protein [Vicingaceae bacterium]
MKNKLAIIIPAVILAVGIGIAYQMIKAGRTLPVYTPAMINPDLVDESKQNVTENHKIPAFELVDEEGEPFTESNLEGKYYVADFFFTTCPTICPDMSSQMMRVQKEFKNHPDFMLVSHSVQPEVDSAEILKEYALRYEAIPGKWVFLTGDKKMIYDLARKAYFAAVTEGDGGPNDFIHTENFVLIDKKKRIRGFYDGTSEQSVNQLITDISILEQEYED